MKSKFIFFSKVMNETWKWEYIYMKPLSTILVVTMTYTLPQAKNGTQFENGLGSSLKFGQIEIFVY